MSFLPRIFRRVVQASYTECCGTTETTANLVPQDGVTLISLTCKGCGRERWAIDMPKACAACGHARSAGTSINNRGPERSVVFRWPCGHTQVHGIGPEDLR